MLKKLIPLILMIFLLPAAASADEARGQLSDTVSWTLDGDTLRIDGVGEIGYTYCTKTAHGEDYAAAAGSAKHIIIGEGITRIAKSALIAAENASDIALPSTLKEIGAAAFTGCTSLTAANIPEGTEIIGERAFSGLTALTEVYLPDTAEEIHLSAFNGCDNLKSVRLTANAYVDLFDKSGMSGDIFSSVEQVEVQDEKSWGIVRYVFGSSKWYKDLLTQAKNGFVVKENVLLAYTGSKSEITVPSGVKIIGAEAFYGNMSVEQITMPSSLEAIGVGAFYGLTQLKQVKLNKSCTIIGAKAFYNCLSADVNCEYASMIGDYAFTNSGVKSVNIDNASYLGEGAFSECARLEDVSIGGTITEIPEEAFYNCKTLVSAEIPESANVIGNRAFYGCQSLKTINLDAVSEIRSEAFYGTESLTIGVPEAVSSMGCRAFYSSGVTSAYIPADADTDVFGGCKRLVSASADSLPDRCFEGCTALSDIAIGENVTKISEYAFNSCTALESVILPDGITEIERGAFYKCTGLTSVSIPDGTKLIGMSAFEGCSALKKIKIGSSVTAINYGTFAGCADIRVTIPSSVAWISDDAFEKTAVIIAPSDSYAYGWAYKNGIEAVADTASRVGEVRAEIVPTDIKTTVNGRDINAYALDGVMLILVRDLEGCGFNVSFDGTTKTAYADYDPEKEITDGSGIRPPSSSVLYTDISVMVNKTKVSGYNVSGYMAVIAEELGLNVPEISTVWIASERELRITVDENTETFADFITDAANLLMLELRDGRSAYFADCDADGVDDFVENGWINADDFNGLLYPARGLETGQFILMAGRIFYGAEYESAELDEGDISYPVDKSIQKYAALMYADGVIDGDFDVYRVLTHDETAQLLERLCGR